MVSACDTVTETITETSNYIDNVTSPFRSYRSTTYVTHSTPTPVNNTQINNYAPPYNGYYNDYYYDNYYYNNYYYPYYYDYYNGYYYPY